MLILLSEAGAKALDVVRVLAGIHLVLEQPLGTERRYSYVASGSVPLKDFPESGADRANHQPEMRTI